jgi:hypothetical protein
MYDDVLLLLLCFRCFSKLFVTMSTLLVGGSTKEARRVSRSVETAVADKISKQIDLKNVFGGPRRDYFWTEPRM